MAVRKIQTDIIDRVESGVLQINDDWPGYFIRGDNALSLAIGLKHARDSRDPIAMGLIVDGLIESFEGVAINAIESDELQEGPRHGRVNQSNGGQSST